MRILDLVFVRSFSSLHGCPRRWRNGPNSPPSPASPKKPTACAPCFNPARSLKLQVCTDSMIHVVYSPTGTIPKQTEYVVTKESWAPVPWKLDSSDKAYTLSTASVKVVLEKDSGAITFATAAAAQPLFRDGKRFMFPETVNGEKTYRSETVVEMYGSHEGFYGLGQHQAGVWNYHGDSVDVSQENTNIAAPSIDVVQGLRDLLEQCLPHALQQPVCPCDVYQRGSSGHHRLLLHVRPRLRQNHRLVSRSYGIGPAVRSLGLWFLAMQEPLQVTGGNSRRGAEISRSASARWTTLSRTGSGGTAKASTFSIRIIPIPRAWWTSSTKKTST